MRSTVIITKRGKGYIAQANGPFGKNIKGVRCGITPDETAAKAAGYMLDYANNNLEGGDLIAPPEILKRIPKHLHSIPSGQKPQSEIQIEASKVNIEGYKFKKGQYAIQWISPDGMTYIWAGIGNTLEEAEADTQFVDEEGIPRFEREDGDILRIIKFI
jgi:hypothetical protein